MKKYIFSFLTTVSLSYAGLVNGIAIVVNDTPITLYDIDLKILNHNMSKQVAIENLIDEILYKQELKKNNITVDIFDIDNHIEKLAQQNNISTLEFKSLIRQQQNYDLFIEQVKKQLVHQKLIEKIAGGKLNIASTDDLNIYYKNHNEEFQVAQSIDVIIYSSKDKSLLNDIKVNPMIQNPNMSIENRTLEQDNLTPQLKYIVNSTKEKNFSVIFPQNNKYNMIFISKKSNIQTIKFKNVKNQIFNKIMKTREQSYLKEYFETLKITANIKILR